MSKAPQIAVKIIKEFEGFSGKAYADPKVGWTLPTIGYGTTRYEDGSSVKKGDKVTREKAEALLQHEVASMLPTLAKIPNWSVMNANQQAALLSFAYNLGANFYRGKNFKSITALCDAPGLWNDEGYIKTQFVKYRNPGSNVEEGLRRRRLIEAMVFLRKEKV